MHIISGELKTQPKDQTWMLINWQTPDGTS